MFAISVVATSEDSPAAMKLKKMWLKTPVSEEQAAQAVLDPALVAERMFGAGIETATYHRNNLPSSSEFPLVAWLAYLYDSSLCGTNFRCDAVESCHSCIRWE
uniref:Uncharacterized protein n=1 Tax=Anopheles maculatus TaxID=74869 RepID=A0A182T540_9DIPT